jgi:hypothetical protein
MQFTFKFVLKSCIIAVMEKSEVAASRPEESPTIITDNIIPDFFHNDLAPLASPIESKHSFMIREIAAIFIFSFDSTQNCIFFRRPRVLMSPILYFSKMFVFEPSELP